MNNSKKKTIALAWALWTNTARSQSIISIPREDTYLLPPTFVNNATQAFVDTQTAGQVNTLLHTAHNASFIAYDPEFLAILGPDPNVTLTATHSAGEAFAQEGGAWAYDHDQVWFTASGQPLRYINLKNSTIVTPSTTAPVEAPNGATYFNGTLYVAAWGNETYAGGVLAIDPITFTTTTLFNSYFGLRLNSIDDLIWAKRGQRAVLFVTDVDYGFDLAVDPEPQLPNAVWRFDPQERTYLPVISRAEITEPNGIAVNANGTVLYVTDAPVSNLQAMGPGNTTGSAAIYKFDLDDTMSPVNKRLFAMARTGVPDGIKVDDAGRVWTAEGEGIVVRSEYGKVLGVINSKPLLDQSKTPIENFALAGDKVVILAFDRIYTVKLPRTIMSAARYQL